MNRVDIQRLCARPRRLRPGTAGTGWDVCGRAGVGGRVFIVLRGSDILLFFIAFSDPSPRALIPIAYDGLNTLDRSDVPVLRALSDTCRCELYYSEPNASRGLLTPMVMCVRRWTDSRPVSHPYYYYLHLRCSWFAVCRIGWTGLGREGTCAQVRQGVRLYNFKL